MLEIITYTLLSVGAVSLIALIGVSFLAIQEKKLRKFLLYTVSFSAGALFADAFIHLLPEALEEHGGVAIPLYAIAGILVSLILEKYIHWRHCHLPESTNHTHPFALMNLFGDGLHNFIDGMIIAASYVVSIPAGIATTIAVIFHEIPQEVGDFGVLLHGGFNKKKAVLVNFLTALTAILGAVIALVVEQYTHSLTTFLVPFAAGTFIYIAGADLIPELHKETQSKKSFWQILSFCLGVTIIAGLVFFE